ncbi:hypothetical protein WICMUC_005085 [Wickerhamomyces mucosus]|uniref:Uncharacterized protein n=1 Tax=Wickerhamomyces mucosus TaxID=1378264 RepID=A0A9P8T7S3_9ASCO|nr:hypothetical protein WICMUC_005085 [Wickerhamomyces mucosus]
MSKVFELDIPRTQSLLYCSLINRLETDDKAVNPISLASNDVEALIYSKIELNWSSVASDEDIVELKIKNLNDGSIFSALINLSNKDLPLLVISSIPNETPADNSSFLKVIARKSLGFSISKTLRAAEEIISLKYCLRPVCTLSDTPYHKELKFFKFWISEDKTIYSDSPLKCCNNDKNREVFDKPAIEVIKLSLIRPALSTFDNFEIFCWISSPDLSS